MADTWICTLFFDTSSRDALLYNAKMSAAEIAEAAKAAGNAAFKAANFDEAIAEFTKAVEADPTNHVLYSNRSGAHAAKADFKAALLDANKCIDLKADWAKGHSRRGAAYFGLKNWIQSQAAYEKGLELDPESKVMKEELEKVKLMRNPTARAAAAAQTAGSAAPSTGLIPKFVSLCALVFGILYMVPLLGARTAFLCYKLCVVQILTLFVVNLYNKFPLKMATLSDPAFTSTQEVQAFVLNIFMLFSPPLPFALMPFLTGCLLNAVHGFQAPIQSLPDFLKSRLLYFTTPEGVFQLNAFGAVSEVIVTFMGPLLVVVQGYRALLMSFFFFQYVARRYKSNQQTQQTVMIFTQKADGWFKHRLVPMPLQNVYMNAKTYVAWGADKLGS